MFQVRAMRAEDYPFAIRLANTMNWNMTRQDLEFASCLEPDGCFILVKGTEPVGMVTCVSYGSVGWFGNLIVKEQERKRGAGTLLVKRAVDYFHDKDIKTVGLYAYPHLTEFYTNLGFKRYEDFAVMQATLKKSDEGNLPKVTAQNISEVADFDRSCFGWDRRKLLEAIIRVRGNFGYFYPEQEKIVGYVVAKVYGNMAEVGSLSCKPDRTDVANRLLECALGELAGLNVYVCLPKSETEFVSYISQFRFTEKFFVARMFLGDALGKNCLYLAESLERG